MRPTIVLISIVRELCIHPWLLRFSLILRFHLFISFRYVFLLLEVGLCRVPQGTDTDISGWTSHRLSMPSSFVRDIGIFVLGGSLGLGLYGWSTTKKSRIWRDHESFLTSVEQAERENLLASIPGPHWDNPVHHETFPNRDIATNPPLAMQGCSAFKVPLASRLLSSLSLAPLFSTASYLVANLCSPFFLLVVLAAKPRWAQWRCQRRTMNVHMSTSLLPVLV
eukprot:g39118.t1